MSFSITKKYLSIYKYIFAPLSWKKGTIKTLLHRLHICSTTEHKIKKIKHLRKVFKEINGYPDWLISLSRLMKEEKPLDIIYTGTRLSTQSNVKKTKKEQ